MKRISLIILAVAVIIIGSVSCQKVNDLDKRLTELEQTVSDLKAQILAGAVITSVDKTADGCTFILSNGQSYTVTNGKNGSDGEAIIADVEIEENFIVLTLKNGETLRISYQNPLSMVTLSIVPDYDDGTVGKPETVEAMGMKSHIFYLDISVTPAKYTEILSDTERFIHKAVFSPVLTKSGFGNAFTVSPKSVTYAEGAPIPFLEASFELDDDTAALLQNKNTPYTVSYVIEDKDGVHGAATAFVAIFKEGVSTEADGVDINEYKGTTIKPGTADNLCIKVEGTFFDSDKVYVVYDGGAATELGTEFYRIGESMLSIYTHRNHIGKKVQYFLHRDDKTYAVCEPLTVITPEVADGFIVDDVWLAKLKGCNTDVASCFDVCDMVILEKAATVNPFASSTNYLLLSGTAAKTFSGMELFSAWTGSTWERADIRAWSNRNLVNVDLSAWQARVYLRLTSCANVETVVLGPKMHGGEFGGGKYKVIDLSLVENLTHFYIQSAETNLELLDMRTGNSLSGLSIDFSKLKEVTDWSGLTVRIKSDMYLRHDENTWRNGIYYLWQNGATIEVFDKDDRTVRLGSVPSYKSNPDALPAEGSYVEGKNWHWTDPE